MSDVPSTDVGAALGDVQSALREADLDALDEALGRLTDEYQSQRRSERPLVARATAARNDAAFGEKGQTVVANLQEQFTETYLGRGSLIAGCELLLLDPGKADREELLAQASELATREEALEARRSEATPIAEDATLPARIGILRFASQSEDVVFGDTIRVDLELENVGDEPASGVVATVHSDGFDVEQSIEVERLSPREHRSLEFSIAASIGGAADLHVTVASDDAGTVEESTTVLVRTKSAIVDRSRRSRNSTAGSARQ